MQGQPTGAPNTGVMKTLTVAEAASLAGTTPKAIRRRIERGTLRSVLGPDQRRRIPLSEIERAGLSPAGATPRGNVGQGTPGDAPAGHSVAGVLDAGQVLQRLEFLAAENGRLRALEEQAGSLVRQIEAERETRERLELALHEARARVVELEARSPWWRRRRRTSQPLPSASG